MFPAPDRPTEKLASWLASLSDEELLDRWMFCREELTEIGREATRRELASRGIDSSRQQSHHQTWENRLWRDGRGHTRVCHRCNRLATHRGWSFRKIFRLIPLAPIRVGTCDAHAEK